MVGFSFDQKNPRSKEAAVSEEGRGGKRGPAFGLGLSVWDGWQGQLVRNSGAEGPALVGTILFPSSPKTDGAGPFCLQEEPLSREVRSLLWATHAQPAGQETEVDRSAGG